MPTITDYQAAIAAAEHLMRDAQKKAMLAYTALLLAEWNGSEYDHRCPVCQESRGAGHMKTCALRVALEALGV